MTFFYLADDSDGSNQHVSLPDFLKLDMKGKFIFAMAMPTFSSSNLYIRSYKTALRLQVNSYLFFFLKLKHVSSVDRTLDFTLNYRVVSSNPFEVISFFLFFFWTRKFIGIVSFSLRRQWIPGCFRQLCLYCRVRKIIYSTMRFHMSSYVLFAGHESKYQVIVNRHEHRITVDLCVL